MTERKKAKWDLGTLLAMIALTISAGLFAVAWNVHRRAEETAIVRFGGKKIGDFDKLRTRFGQVKGQFLVVEFGDYSCPFCRKMQAELDDFFSQHRDVGYEFRNLPLTGIHPLAFDAALLAEYSHGTNASDHGPVRSLIEENLTAQDLLATAAIQNTDSETHSVNSRKESYLRVVNDLLLAQRLGLTGTPTFVVILKNGDGYALDGNQLVEFLSWKYYS